LVNKKTGAQGGGKTGPLTSVAQKGLHRRKWWSRKITYKTMRLPGTERESKRQFCLDKQKNGKFKTIIGTKNLFKKKSLKRCEGVRKSVGGWRHTYGVCDIVLKKKR